MALGTRLLFSARWVVARRSKKDRHVDRTGYNGAVLYGSVVSAVVLIEVGGAVESPSKDWGS
jgi:hypothetical protein